MKPITILLLMISSLLFSCNAPTIKPQTRMTPSFQFNYGSEEKVNNFFENIDQYKDPALRKKFVADFLSIFGKCRQHLYDLTKIKRVSDAKDFPLSACDDVTGFSPDSWAKQITPWGNELKRFYEDTCQ